MPWAGLRGARACLVAEAADGVFVGQSRSLHEGVCGGGPDEVEAVRFEAAAECVGYLGVGGDGLGGEVPWLQRCVVGERPDVSVKVGNGTAQGDQRAGIGEDRGDLSAVADDAGILEQAVHLILGPGGDLVGVEVGEGAAVTVAAGQDGGPAQSCLGAF